MQITKHFSLNEFHCKDGTPYPGQWIQSRLKPLCEQLEIIRKHFGDKPIHIASGYRTEAYNRTVGGAPKSQHIQGRAADIWINGVSTQQTTAAIRKLIDQGLLQIRGLGVYRSFTHIDMRPATQLAYWDNHNKAKGGWTNENTFIFP